MKRIPLLLALAGLLCVGLHAADLVPGLSYLRPALAPEVVKAPDTGSTVVDLRYVGDEAAAATLLATLKAVPPSEHRIILALVSPETPAGLRARLASMPRCLTIGLTAAGFKTDIAVTTTPEADHRAFDALTAGTAATKLISENTDKTRYDEVALAKEHSGAQGGPVKTDGDKPVDPPSPVPVDAVLQCAVQIYQGLVALKRI
ncbi:MAG: hypothetical protein WC205_17265 [Opitutaceae bacterium]|jgi:hypothetical protein